MKRIPKKEVVDVIREKIIKGDYQLNQNEINAVDEVYNDITGLVRDKSCHLCLNQTFKIIFNYITYHEVKEVEQPKTENNGNEQQQPKRTRAKRR